MTPQQLATLRAYIDSVPAWSALPNNSESADLIARALNAEATPAFYVYKTSLPTDEVMDATTMGHEGAVSYADVQSARSL